MTVHGFSFKLFSVFKRSSQVERRNGLKKGEMEEKQKIFASINSILL